jgi:hypothetical protein
VSFAQQFNITFFGTAVPSDHVRRRKGLVDRPLLSRPVAPGDNIGEAAGSLALSRCWRAYPEPSLL